MEVVRGMLARLESVALPANARLRMTPPEQVHLTLQFIGDTPAGEMEGTEKSVRRAAAGLPVFALNAHELIALPERGPKRLIAAETDAPPALLELQKRLAMRLAHNVREKPGRKFRPHITLGRFASPVKAQALAMMPVRIEGLSFVVDRIILMRSTLSSQGATHHEVMEASLDH